MRSSRDAVFGNTDLVTMILLWLPVKDLLRFKCVCKLWLSLISNPEFCYSHTLRLCRTSSPSNLLLRRSDSDSEFQIVPFTNSNAVDPSPVRTWQFDNIMVLNFDYTFAEIVQSCNGYLLFKTTLSSGHHRPIRHSYCVVNPTTDHSLRVEFPTQNFKNKVSALYLDFDPLRSPHFKAISFRNAQSDNTSNPNMFEINVYSSENDTWSEDGVCFVASPSMSVDSGVYSNGAIHWYTPGKDSIYFDVHQQRFNTLPEPASLDYNDLHVKYFGESRGHLHLILFNGDESLDFDILELKEDYSAWIVKYHVDLNLIGIQLSQHAGPPFSILCVVRQANEEGSMLVVFTESRIMSYNLKDHTSKIMYEVDEVSQSFQYFETLLNVGLKTLD